MQCGTVDIVDPLPATSGGLVGRAGPSYRLVPHRQLGLVHFSKIQSSLPSSIGFVSTLKSIPRVTTAFVQRGSSRLMMMVMIMTTDVA